MQSTQKTNWLLGIIGVLGFMTVWGVTLRMGQGVTFDSLVYFWVSKSLLAGNGYSFLDVLYTDQPPLYPTLLALLNLGGLDPIDASALLNASSYGLILFFSGKWLYKSTRSRPVAMAASAILLVSVPLLRLFFMAWTEPLFIALIMLSLYQLDQFLREDRLGYLLGSGVLASLACLTRYAGVAVVGAGLLTLLLRRHSPNTRKLLTMGIFGLTAVLPTSIWLVRNLLVGGYVTAFSTTAPHTLTENLGYLFEVLSLWLLPLVVNPAVRRSGAVLVVVILLSWFTLLIWKDQTDLTYRNFMPVVSFFFTYPAVMVYAATTVSLFPLDNRYVSPIYVPLVVLMCAAIHCTQTLEFPHWMRRTLRAFFIAGLTLMLVNSLGEGIRNPTEGSGDPGTVFMRKFDVADSTQTFFDSGLALAQLGRDFEAFVWYTHALELSPDSYDIHNNLGLALVQLGARDRALKHFDRALEIDPDRVEAYTNIGLFLLKDGRLDEAVKFFSIVIEGHPDHIQAYANLGSIREAQGNTQEAIRIYRQALEQRPDYEPVRQSLNRLLSGEN
jgi:hypothetical protein